MVEISIVLLRLSISMWGVGTIFVCGIEKGPPYPLVSELTQFEKFLVVLTFFIFFLAWVLPFNEMFRM